MPMGINVAPAVWSTAMVEKFMDLLLFTFTDDFMRFKRRGKHERNWRRSTGTCSTPS
jgi:hypothetical protein